MLKLAIVRVNEDGTTDILIDAPLKDELLVELENWFFFKKRAKKKVAAAFNEAETRIKASTVNLP